MSKRVMFYSHDTFGLGHIRRTQKIANAIADGEKSILIACSSPLANSFNSMPGIEYLNLPGFAKQLSGEYKPRSLNIPIEEFVSLRANLLLAAVKNFQPDLMIVDKEPLGVKGELLPSLRYIREKNLGTRLVCGFRDILDDKEKVSEEWDRRGVLKGLEDFYDDLLVYGEEKHFDFRAEYSIPDSLSKKVVYTGYVQPKENPSQEFFPLDFAKDRPIVTFTLGGGGDGWNYIDVFLTMIENRTAGEDANFVLLTGPFANLPLVERAKKLEGERNNFKVLEFTNNALGLFDRSRLVISMGGYNSFCELAQMRKFPLLLPRVVPRQEQLIRAKVFHGLGYCDYIHPHELNAENLGAKVRDMVAADRSQVPAFETHGLKNISQFIEEALGCRPKSGSFSKVIPA
jgi:predicted glycosyltransferase